MSAEDETLVDYDDDEEVVKEDTRGGPKLKGRGHKDTRGSEADRGGVYESLQSSAAGPIASIEGYVIFVSGLHNEAQEDQVLDIFAEVGTVKNIQMNLDRQTGFVKGYALIEYGEKEEADRAIKDLNGTDFLGQTLKVDYAFVKPSGNTKRKGGR